MGCAPQGLFSHPQYDVSTTCPLKGKCYPGLPICQPEHILHKLSTKHCYKWGHSFNLPPTCDMCSAVWERDIRCQHQPSWHMPLLAMCCKEKVGPCHKLCCQQLPSCNVPFFGMCCRSTIRSTSQEEHTTSLRTYDHDLTQSWFQ